MSSDSVEWSFFRHLRRRLVEALDPVRLAWFLIFILNIILILILLVGILTFFFGPFLLKNFNWCESEWNRITKISNKIRCTFMLGPLELIQTPMCRSATCRRRCFTSRASTTTAASRAAFGMANLCLARVPEIRTRRAHTRNT